MASIDIETDWADKTQRQKVEALLAANEVVTAEDMDCEHFGVLHFWPGATSKDVKVVLKWIVQVEGYRVVQLRDLTYLLLKDAV